MTLPPLTLVWQGVESFGVGVYNAVRFALRFGVEAVQPPYHPAELVRQCYEIGCRSLPLITLTGLVTGVVFTKQSRPSLEVFGATSWLPSLITIALVKSLAPLITALICAGKVGSNIGAEIGSMKVTEQIEAMEVSAINPFKFLVVTRTLAASMMVPVLTTYCCIVGLVGSFANIHGNEGTSLAGFLSAGFSTIGFIDIGASLAKTVIFGFTIGIVACYQGYNAGSGTRGVGKAANASVVLSMFAIFMEEVLIVQIILWVQGFAK